MSARSRPAAAASRSSLFCLSVSEAGTKGTLTISPTKRLLDFLGFRAVARDRDFDVPVPVAFFAASQPSWNFLVSANSPSFFISLFLLRSCSLFSHEYFVSGSLGVVVLQSAGHGYGEAAEDAHVCYFRAVKGFCLFLD